MTPRETKNWITEYVKLVSEMSESPEAYHWWSAATVIGAVLKRHVWIGRGTYRLFPNMYTVLVGRPGIGKGAAMNPAIDFLKASKAAAFMTGRITIEYVMERMSKGFSGPVPKGDGTGMTIGNDSALLVFSPEFNVFITASQFSMKILTDLWDSKEGEWEYGTRHSGQWMIKDPCLSIIAGCSSEALVELLPSAAIGSGFTRRVNFVYARDNDQLIPWPPDIVFQHPGLTNDLRRMAMITGKFTWTKPAKILFEKYYEDTRKIKEYQDEATAAYDTTRFAHAAKLAMIISISRRDNLVIDDEDFFEAMERVDKCAECLSYVFRSAGESNMAVATSKIFDYITAKGFTSRKDILAHNWRHVNTQELDVVLATLVAGGMVEETSQGRDILYSPTP